LTPFTLWAVNNLTLHSRAKIPMKPSRWLFAFVLLIGVGLSVNAPAADKIGVVVLHGKWGSPDGHTSGLANFLAGEGFLVVSPEMPWSGRRTYDKGADAFVAEIDVVVAELRTKGAKKIAVIGHSQGASAALYYSTQRQVNGIALIAPGGYPQSKTFLENYAAAVAEARALVGQGKADAPVAFTDLNTGNRSRSLRVPARSVLDYFDPEGPMNSYQNAARVKTGVAVLLAAPKRESEGLKRLSNETYEKLSGNAKPSRVEIDADHLQAPDAAKEPVSEWLKRL